MKRSIIIASACLLLANNGGCFGRSDPVRVEVPIRAPCVNAADVPAETAPLGPLPEAASAALDLAVAKLLEVRGEARALRALVQGCTAP